MELKHHILYQKVIAHGDALESILKVFEQVLEEKGFWNRSKERQRAHQIAEDNGETGKTRAYYNALLFSTFFDRVKHEDVLEYIDLARKDLLARRMLKYLNVTKDDPEKIRDMLQEFCEIPIGRFHVSPTITLGIRVDLISQFISDHRSYIGVAKHHINMRDVAEVLSRSIGSISQTGVAGGKAAGMILANRILRPTLETADPEFAEAIEEPESYFLKSCVAAEFLTRNNLQECHSLKYLDGKSMEAVRETLRDRFQRGTFSEHVIEKFKDILQNTEGSPLILRSSSYLEDGVGYSFSGKYDSVFISNRGTLEERFQELIQGIKDVYLSLYSAHAIEYRRDKNLLDYNERMAVLIQKVIGTNYGKYFFPAVSIVGFSKNAYCWNNRIKKEDGMLRIVMGLGTRAVERVGDDYPRMVSLSEPTLRPEVTMAEKIKYSQRYVDVLNLETRQVETHNFVDLINEILAEGHTLNLRDIISIAEDDMLKTPIFFPDNLEHGKCAITFDGLLKQKKFPRLLKRVMKKVEAVYGMPVDMEFVFHDGKLYVLQCRHLLERTNVEDVTIPSVADEDILFTAQHGFTNAIVKDIDTIVYVDEDAYASLPSTHSKMEIARVIGRINNRLAEKRFILMGPGRWGSSNIDLGVPVKYNDINNSQMLIEIAHEKNGVTPEVSYGTHFFQDLVEANIIPLPLYPDEKDVIFNTDFFARAENRLAAFEPDQKELTDVIKVIDMPHESGGRRLSVYLDENTPRGVGFVQ